MPPPPIFTAVVCLILLGMSYEWQQFVKLPEVDNRFFKTLLIFLGSLIVAHFWPFFLYINLCFWVIGILLILSYPKYLECWAHSGLISAVGWLLLGIFASIMSEWQKSTEGVEFLFSVLLIVWAADIGAYLAGRQWGKHKMLPAVSPGKSWEGLLGGMFLVLIVAYLENLYLDMDSLILWLGVAMLTAVLSVFGDLWISVLKRNVSLKDTGHLIPGHGGLLDRMDSLLAAVPVFYICTRWLG